MPRLIMFKGGVETLTFFSEQLAHYFEDIGYELFWYDLEKPQMSGCSLQEFLKQSNDSKDVCMLTFNFMGLTQEAGVYENDSYVWEQWNIPCFNIVVDHPLYYSDHYEQLPNRYYQISIDREHEIFMNTYYPEIKSIGFCPLAGTALPVEDSIDHTDVDRWLKQRPMDVLFVGNYKNPQEYEQYITRIDEEYTTFYRGMIEDLLMHPERSLDVVAREHCLREMGELSIEEWRLAFQYLNFIDLYVRFTARERVLQSLLEAGITVHIYGTGYEEFKTKHPECMILHGGTDSLTCLQEMRRCKISLNVMPWFKNGAHDRIFNAMANESVSVTDSNVYLREILQDETQVIFYDLLDMDGFAQKVKQWLTQPEDLFRIAMKGKQVVLDSHLWKHRAIWIAEQIEKENADESSAFSQ